MIRQRSLVACAAGFQPSRPTMRREVLPSHAQLIHYDMLGWHRVVVEARSKAVADDRLGIVQDSPTQESALQAEVEVFDAPIAHVHVEPSQMIVKRATRRQRASAQRRGLIVRKLF